jgi:hypothetical protein
LRDFGKLLSYRSDVPPIVLILPLIVLLQGRTTAPDDSEVVIVRREPTADRITFDLHKPPADMPKLHPGEAALCQFNFNCEVKLRYEVMDQGTSRGRSSVTAHIRQVRVTLTLHNRIYLPRGANAKIRAHEEGHRIINERVYEDAEKVARAAGIDALTQSWRGSGDTPEAAAKNATDRAVQFLCDTYLAGTANKAARVGEIYDELTSHGRNTRLSEADAITQAFSRYASEQTEAAPAAGR